MVCEHDFASGSDETKIIDLEELEDFPTTRNTEYKVSDIRYSEWEKKYKKKIPKFHFL